jgi:glutathione S-transferase
MWFKLGIHPCWRVQKALDEAGIDYEVVQGPARRGRRTDLKQMSGQDKYPTIEFEDGSAYRDESARMAEEIAAGRLEQHRSPGTTPASG